MTVGEASRVEDVREKDEITPPRTPKPKSLPGSDSTARKRGESSEPVTPDRSPASTSTMTTSTTSVKATRGSPESTRSTPSRGTDGGQANVQPSTEQLVQHAGTGFSPVRSANPTTTPTGVTGVRNQDEKSAPYVPGSDRSS